MSNNSVSTAKFRLPTISLSTNALILWVSLFFTVVFNFPFLSRCYVAITHQETYNLAFMLSVPLFLFCILTIFFSLLAWRWVFKPILIILILLSSLVFYAGLIFGIVFDYGMIQNTFDTNLAEASMYLNPTSVGIFLLSGVLPAFLVSRVALTPRRIWQHLYDRVMLILTALSVLFIIAYCFYSSYAAVGRNNHEMKRYIIPFQYISSSVKYVRDHYFTHVAPFDVLDSSPKLWVSSEKKRVLIFVLGETARAANFSYNGYPRNTNPFTASENLISFHNVASCGTATAVSVPCMFSPMNRDNYEERIAKNQDNVLDIAQRAGVHVSWIENDGGCKNMCDRVKTIKVPSSDPLCEGGYCLDESVLPYVEQELQHLQNGTTFLVIHQMGSHGPTYYQRYPKEYRKFTPDCPRSDIQNCTTEALVNTYDNTLVYTDYILSQLILRLKQLPNDVDTALIYASDHGESLGEHGVYLHGLPYAFAPKEQTQVPMLLWLPPAFLQANGMSRDCLMQQARGGEFSHDNLFHSMLGLLDVHSSTYLADKDWGAQCRLPPNQRLSMQ